MTSRHGTIADRIMKHSIPEPNSGCWLWLGSVSSDTGYARINLHGKNRTAHRISYEVFKGPIPKDLCLDHLCRVRCCVNPDHLDAVTMQENILRGIGPTAVNAAKTHCPRGHQFNDKNTYVYPSGARQCRTCRSEYMRAWHKTNYQGTT